MFCLFFTLPQMPVTSKSTVDECVACDPLKALQVRYLLLSEELCGTFRENC